MTLSNSTLAAIQKVGAAAFTADEKLKAAVQKYAQRVNEAMMANPYGLGNNSLFETWKVVARLSQTMAGIEEELKKVYLVASELAADDHPGGVQVLTLSAPVRESVKSESVKPDAAPIDVRVKRKKNGASPKVGKAQGKTKLKAAPIKAKAAAQGKPIWITGNALKLMEHLQGLLNANELTAINQTAVSKDTGIPMGSMTAALKKLIASGRLIAGPLSSFKLANVEPAPVNQG